MASFYAELYVEGRVYPVLRCSLEFNQATRERGRVAGRVRHGPLQVLLDVPDDDTLVAWAADPHKKLAGHLIFFDTARLSPHESIEFAQGECVRYQEDFEPDGTPTGAYQCTILITAPQFVLGNGFPAAAPEALPRQLAAAAAGPTPHLAAQLQEVVESKAERYQKRLRLIRAGQQKLDTLTAPALPALAAVDEAPAARGPLARLGSALGLRGGAAASPALTPEELLQANRATLGTAVQRLAFNNVAVERARLSAHAYAFTTTNVDGTLVPEFTRPVPEGWAVERVWDDPDTGFAAALYRSSFEEPNAQVLAFRGTNPTEMGDIKADVLQALGRRTEQYDQAILRAQEVATANDGAVDIVEGAMQVTGHSLGGGLASAAAMVANVRAYTFNAAGLHRNTVAAYGITAEDFAAKQHLIEHVYSSQDPLNWVQNHMGGLIPKAAGTQQHVLPQAGFHPIQGVVDAIEKQKDEDTATIRRFTAP
ncbi:type VI secretion system tube protein TssD [Hymenobacter sp. CRA2]|uniref:type VI secretion system tube protein TssD n=1 Tax=Hymenobacter sp. CRA2 TaxID=1955620 RepID=UPI00099025CA|nr:type VI secretion system tube protein TssD [Hymenobacter sp. CRA2]OON69101.1 hypothetical protein B0919_10350 [Hymenobacter sp. CRA2]